MGLIWTEKEPYHRAKYKNEADLEEAILEVQDELFGANRIYLPVKKKIGAKGGQRNIPDGYLIDLNGPKPRLYVVENELAAHDPLRHVAVQILEFSLSFEAEPRTVKTVLFHALQHQRDAKSQCERYATKNGYRNLDYLLEYLVYEAPFAALVVIDEVPDTLQNVMAEKFQFGVEVLELAPYENSKGRRQYTFEPFLVDLLADSTTSEAADVDTVVVPAREEGFKRVFLGENRWHAIRIHGTIRPQLKHIAVYQVFPISAITYIAPVKSIAPWKGTGKFVVNFAEPARKIGPISLVKKGRVRHLQNLRYTTREKLLAAKTLDKVW